MEKIVVFTPSLNIGGIERILLTYAKGLAEKGYNVTYLTLSNKGDFQIQPCKNLFYGNLGVKRLRLALFVLIKFLKQNKPNIIFCANEATMMVYIAKTLSGIPARIITSQHNYYENYLGMSFKKTFVPRYIFPLCYKVIAVSDGIRKMLINDFNNKPTKVVTISNPIDATLVQKQADEIVLDLPNEYVLFVGRFDKVKNIQLLINAYKLFNQRFPNVKLLLIGGGPELESITNHIKELNLQDEIKFLGIKSNPFPYIKKAKIIALSSKSEAFPTVLIESLILGKTIVSTPTFGAIEILNSGKYGYLSDSVSDVSGFYNKLVEAYLKPLDPNLLENYSLLNFSLDLKLTEFENLWKKKQ